MLTNLILSITLSILTLINPTTSANTQPTQQATQTITEDSTAVSNSFYTDSSIQPAEAHILTSIDAEGYYFTNPNTNTGAFIPASEAAEYNLTNLSEGNIVSISFDSEGDILTVEGGN
jgi:hypothetical protein